MNTGESEGAELRLEIQKVYDAYPLKKGKERGFKILMATLSKETVRFCLDAAMKYSEICARENTDPKFIKHFSTFASSWKEILDDDYGKSTIKPTVGSNSRSDWSQEAEIILQACKAHGFSDAAIRPIVGNDRADLLRKAGGAFSLGQMPNTEFTTKALAGKLKAAHELMNMQKEAG